MIELHQHKTYKCYICNREHKTYLSIYSHLIRKHIVSSIKCESCDKIFINDMILKKHFNLVHAKSERIKCEHCLTIFKRK